MRHLSVVAAMAALCLVASAKAAVLYSAGVGSDTGAGTATTIGYTEPITGDPFLNMGFGDDYTTTGGTTGTVTINQLEFNGGVSVADGQLAFNFYNADGSSTGISIVGSFSVAANLTWILQFAPVDIPSSGYLIFAPVPDGNFQNAPGSTAMIGQASSVDVGSNDADLTASSDVNGTLTTGAFLPAGPQTLSFQLDNVPEPASLSLAAIPFLGMLRRSRRKA